jgi:hypothetical protein
MGTLISLMITICVLGILLLIVVLALRSLVDPHQEPPPQRRIPDSDRFQSSTTECGALACVEHGRAGPGD